MRNGNLQPNQTCKPDLQIVKVLAAACTCSTRQKCWQGNTSPGLTCLPNWQLFTVMCNNSDRNHLRTMSNLESLTQPHLPSRMATQELERIDMHSRSTLHFRFFRSVFERKAYEIFFEPPTEKNREEKCVRVALMLERGQSPTVEFNSRTCLKDYKSYETKD